MLLMVCRFLSQLRMTGRYHKCRYISNTCIYLYMIDDIVYLYKYNILYGSHPCTYKLYSTHLIPSTDPPTCYV